MLAETRKGEDMTHQVGDRVRVNCPKSEAHGQETVITNPSAVLHWNGQTARGNEVDIATNRPDVTPFCIFDDDELIPIYDGHEKTEWEDCIFKPRVLETI